jgi:hypothetical protein
LFDSLLKTFGKPAKQTSPISFSPQVERREAA